MTTLDYTRLFDADVPRLGLDFDAPGRILPWLIIDRACDNATYYKTATLDAALSFIQTAVARGDATADETDVEYWRRWQAQLGHSVAVNRLWDRAQDTFSERGKSEVAAAAGPSPRSENVLAFPRRPLEPLDEVGA